MQRTDYGIKNSRIWHICTQDLAGSSSITLDNWTRYNYEYREVYYLNDTVKFLEVDHFNQTFKFFKAPIRKNNIEDFKRFFGNYLKYKEV